MKNANKNKVMYVYMYVCVYMTFTKVWAKYHQKKKPTHALQQVNGRVQRRRGTAMS